MSEPTARALEVFSGHLRRLEVGENSDLEVLCGEHEDLADELRQLHREWSRMSEVLDRLGPKQGTLSLQLRERYGESVDPEISLSQPDEGGGVLDESSEALMNKLSSQGGSERYRARDEIARGGMGAILKVWDEDLRRPLAMKVALREDGGTTGAATDNTSQKRLSRFLEEAQITSQLDHPGIVPVHDLGIDAEGRVYFTMQLVDGRDMRDVVAMAQRGEEGWDLRRLVGVLVRVCEALAYAHSKGVVHRDIKPGNVMVGKFGEVFVMDWGLAKVMGRDEVIDEPTSTIIHTLRSDGSSAEHTLAGDVVGTPAFMAPEQALGRGGEVGPASDLYAVGAMLYLMLTGQIPYQPLGESTSALEILEAVKTGPPWPIRKINPDAPLEVVAICEKAMAREIPDRFSDAMALGDELRNWLEGHAVATYETGLFYGLRKWVGRNKGMTGALIGLVFVVIGGLGLLFQQQQASIQSLEVEQEQTKIAQKAAEANADQANLEAEMVRKQGEELRQAQAREDLMGADRQKLAEQNRRARYRAQIMAAWFSLRLFEADRTRQRLADAEKDLQGWEWGYLSLGSDDSVQTPLHQMGSLDLVAAGDYAVSMGSDAVVRVFDSTNWSHVDKGVRFGIPGLIAKGRNVCALNADGILATATQSNVVLLWDLKSLEQTEANAISAGDRFDGVMDLAFSADGLLLGAVDTEGNVRVWDIALKEVLWETKVDGSLNCIAFHPENNHVAFGADNGRVDIWVHDGEGGKRFGGFVEEHGSPIHALVYSNDGELLASAGEDGEVQLWKEAVLEADERPGRGRISSIGDFLQVGVQTAQRYLERPDPKLRLRGHRQGATCLAFSWDDRVVYAGGGDGTVRAWSAIDGGNQGVWDGHQGKVHGLATLKGERVLSGAEDGTLRVFDPYWEATQQMVGDEDGGAVLFVGEGAAGAGALALSAKGMIHRERPEEALEGAKSLVMNSESWIAGAQVGEYVGLAGSDDSVWILDPGTGEVLRTLKGHDADVVDIASDKLGVRVITGSSDSRAIVWEGVDPFEELESWDITHDRGVVAVAMSADAKVVATADKDKTVRLWDAVEQSELQVWSSAHKWQISAVAISPAPPSVRVTSNTKKEPHKGKRLASASKEVVLVFEVGEPEPVKTLGPHKADVMAVVFHEDGDRLVSGDVNGNIYLWEVAGGEELIELEGHDAAITSLAFVDKGKTLLSGDASGVVYAWRSERGTDRYERFEQNARTVLREERIMRYFEGDLGVAQQRLKEGVPGLSADDPVVQRLLEITAPSAQKKDPADGE